MQGIILFAHGSRDPQWHQPMETVAAHLRDLDGQTVVACAYLELSSPDLATAAAQLVQLGVARLAVLPMFLGVGKHVRDDLPVLMAQLRAQHPALPMVLLPPVGHNPQLLELLARVALEGAATAQHDASLTP